MRSCARSCGCMHSCPGGCCCAVQCSAVCEGMMIEPVVLVHGGAAFIAQDRVTGKVQGVQAAAQAGYAVLAANGTAVDAVEAAVRFMENDEYFNAGYGAVLNVDGEAELDASIMDGTDLSAGAVAMVRDIANPISLARRVKDRTPHVLLAGAGASDFATRLGDADVRPVPPASLVSAYAMKMLHLFKERGCRPEDRELGGTVGAVAVDRQGRVAAGTSTGGTTGKLPGRIGDTPLIGSGTYADGGIGAVSCTGNGEAIMKSCLAHAILQEMSQGAQPGDAIARCTRRTLDRVHGTAGAIAVSSSGAVGIHFTTCMMPWAYRQHDQLHYGLMPGQHETCTLTANHDTVSI